MADLLVKIVNLSLYLPEDTERKLVLKDLNLEVADHKHIALLGANGSGKSTLLRLIAGEIWHTQGQISWQLEPNVWDDSRLTAKQMCRLVSPQIQANYQRQGWHISGLDLILTGLTGDSLLYNQSEAFEENLAKNLAKDLGCSDLLDEDIARLSQGQLRILLIARALISQPKILLLDECSDGLDIPHRERLFAFLEQVANKTTLIIATHRPKHLPKFCQSRLYLQSGRLVTSLDPQNDNSVPSFKPKFFKAPRVSKNSLELFKLVNANVYMDGIEILHQINWTVIQGERWLLAGANGSGKSTLLRLLYGDEFCAAGGHIIRKLAYLNNGQGGEVSSLSELRQKVSLVAPLAESTYGYDLKGVDLVLSGFGNTIGLYRDYSSKEKDLAQELCRAFFSSEDLEQVLNSPKGRLSTGQLRRLFLARALVSEPEVLLLDEPCLGLDIKSRELYMQLLDQLANGEILNNQVTIILISHNLTDIPSCINRKAMMHEGYLKILES